MVFLTFFSISLGKRRLYSLLVIGHCEFIFYSIWWLVGVVFGCLLSPASYRFITDEFLSRELSRHGKIASPVKKSMSCKSNLLKQVVSHR